MPKTETENRLRVNAIGNVFWCLLYAAYILQCLHPLYIRSLSIHIERTIYKEQIFMHMHIALFVSSQSVG